MPSFCRKIAVHISETTTAKHTIQHTTQHTTQRTIAMFKSWKSRIQSHYSYSSQPSFVNDHWAIHQGKPKSSPDQKVSVHIFDKKKFESLLSKNGLHKKAIVAEIYDFLRLQISNLTKFKHPLFLNILEPFEETGSKIIIVSEYISTSLAHSHDLALSQLEILKGLLQVSKALRFLNTDAQYLHLNLQPSSILINELNDWKLSGLGFITTIDFDQFKDYALKSYDPRMPHFISLNLDFAAPELVQDMKVFANTDVWSLGALIYYVYNNNNNNNGDGSKLLNCSYSANYYTEEYSRFEQQLTNNHALLFKRIPGEFHAVLLKMLQKSPMMRMGSVDEFIASSVFSSSKELSCLIYLDEEFPVVKDELKLEFLTFTLLPILDSFPKDLKTNKILQFALALIASKQNILILPVLYQIIFKIGIQELSNLSFHDLILSKVYSHLSLILTSNEVTLVILSNLEQIHSKVTNNEDQFTKFIKQLFSKTLELDTTNNPVTTQTTIKSLELTPLLLETLDFPFLKNTIFPKISNLFTKTTSLNIKLQTILSIQSLVMHKTKGLDKFIIKDSIIPLLRSMKARDPKVLIHVLGLYQAMLDHKITYDDELVILEILPKIWELSNAESLKLSDYIKFTQVINDITKNVQALKLDKLRKSDVSSGTATPTQTPTQTSAPTLTTTTTISPQQPIQPEVKQVVKPRVTPLTLTPTSKIPALSTPPTHRFGSNFTQPTTPTSTYSNNLLNSRNKPTVSYDDDEFDAFQGYTDSSSALAPLTPGNANGNSGSTTTTTTIDWTKESYKSQNIKLPPGFSDSLVASKAAARNNGNSWNDDGSVSLI
jgi:SCY1-like protein 2